VPWLIDEPVSGFTAVVDDVVGRDEFASHVSSGLIHQDSRVSARGDGERYLDQLERHGFGIAQGQHQPCAPLGEAQDMLAMFRADCAKDMAIVSFANTPPVTGYPPPVSMAISNSAISSSRLRTY